MPHPSTQPRVCASCGASIDHLNARAKFCNITCNSSHWHASNPDKNRAKALRNYHAAGGKDVQRAYRQEHAHDRQRWARESRRNDPDRYRAYWAQWYEGNRESSAFRVKTRRGRIRGNSDGVEFSLRDWQRLVRRYRGCCAYCGVKAEPVYMDHVVPLARGGRHSIGNVLPVCFYCNSTKHSMLLAVWRHRNLGGRGAPADYARGERNGNTRVTEDQVREIRKLYSAGTKQVVLAEMFSLTQAAISNMVRRKTWTHIE